MTGAERKTVEQLVLLGQAGIPEPDIRRHVEKLCHSPAFDDRDRARELLRYLVDEALAGRVPRPADIARKLGKINFNPGESYVRSITGDLRNYLKEHYDAPANAPTKPDEIRLIIPKQQYFILAPRATGKTTARTPARSDSHTVAGILEPDDRAEVYQRVTVRGRIDALNLDLRPWLVVRTPCGDLYPQCFVSRNTPEWEHEVHIGLVQWGADEGAEYEINLVAANADGDAAFYQYLKSGRDGFGPLLPTDSIVLDSKRVTRRDIRPAS
jgi:hypothetical protein